jgi:hypothetical protein
LKKKKYKQSYEITMLSVASTSECLNEYLTIILPVVLYGCETWSLTLREEHRLIGFDNRVLRICAQKRDEMVGGWRNLHNDELYNLYCLPSIIRMIKSRRMRWSGYIG